ncbi:hypothetical protein SLE2022_299970 [Rubroshorea leprosula]
MAEVVSRCHGNLVVFWMTMAVELLLLLSVCPEITPPRRTNLGHATQGPLAVQLTKENEQVVIDNGLVRVTLSTPDGYVTGIQYNGVENVLDGRLDDNDRGYWDVVWNGVNFDKVATSNFKIVTLNDDQAELSFSKTWTSSNSIVPLNVDRRVIVRRGVSGIYLYSIMEKPAEFPTVEIDQIRVVFKLQKWFNYMAISDSQQRIMPVAEDRDPGRCETLGYKEAVLLTNPTNPSLRGQVDDKYQYSVEDKDNKVHGWMAADPLVGFWMITPSDEFRVGGPIKQDLTSHTGPINLNMFVSTHYAGIDMDLEYKQGEPWKKVFGPVLVYLNSAPSWCNYNTLWKDAKRQMLEEVRSWPYNFVASPDFPPADQRGQVFGQLVVADGYVSNKPIFAKGAYVGLAAPGNLGSWQTQTKGYQFWTQADRKGGFFINKVRSGIYNLYAWVPGVVGDYKLDAVITINPGSNINLGLLTYNPPRNGPTLWEIGIPDRTAREFFIPDPYPTLLNPLYIDHGRYRQYGLWERYAEIYPHNDLVFTVGVSNYARDWFYAHVTRNLGDGDYKAATWQIVFHLQNVLHTGNYTLQLALASASYAKPQVRFNDPNAPEPDFETPGRIGSDNAIARHGIHGLYRFYSIQVPSNKLRKGTNTIYLTQALNTTPFQGVMYDYIRFEEPGQ